MAFKWFKKKEASSESSDVLTQYILATIQNMENKLKETGLDREADIREVWYFVLSFGASSLNLRRIKENIPDFEQLHSKVQNSVFVKFCERFQPDREMTEFYKVFSKTYSGRLNRYGDIAINMATSADYGKYHKAMFDELFGNMFGRNITSYQEINEKNMYDNSRIEELSREADLRQYFMETMNFFNKVLWGKAGS